MKVDFNRIICTWSQFINKNVVLRVPVMLNSRALAELRNIRVDVPYLNSFLFAVWRHTEYKNNKRDDVIWYTRNHSVNYNVEQDVYMIGFGVYTFF